MKNNGSKGTNNKNKEALVGHVCPKDEIMERLAQVTIDYIGEKVLEGITYVLLLDEPNNSERFKELAQLRLDMTASGVDESSMMRCYDVANGYIFDMDMNVARAVVAKLAEREHVNVDLIRDEPEKRRQADLERLAKLCAAAFKHGKSTIEVALFSRNSVHRINITGKANGKPTMVTYDAFAIRHKDIDEVNRLMARSGARITQVATHEILTSQTGVRVTLKIGMVR